MEKFVTITEVAETYGRKPDTLWRKAKRTWPEREWRLSSAVTEEEGRILLGDEPAPLPAKKRKQRPVPFSADFDSAMQQDFGAKTWDIETITVNQPAPAVEAIPPAPGRAKINWPTMRQMRRFGFNTVCLAIILGHAGLIWYDCGELWQEAGQIGGGLAFLFVCGCVLLATDSTRVRTSSIALWVMAGVDAVAWWAHWPVFTRQMTAYDMKVETGVLCGVICGLSFFALVLYRDEKID